MEIKNSRLRKEKYLGNLISINGMIGGAVSFDDLEEVVENDPEIGPSFAVLMLTFLENQLDADLEICS